MEGSNSEAIFESLNLNPQLFINEAFNIVDELLDSAFYYFLKESSELLKIEDSDRHADLSKGVAYVQNLIQSTLDQRLQKWEEYCLRFCFHTPEGFSLPKANESSADYLPVPNSLVDTHLDAELNSLRDKLTLVGKETAELAREVRGLERQSLSSNQSAGSIDEALLLYKRHDTSQVFQELATTASEFRSKVMNLKRKMVEDTQRGRADKMRMTNGDDVLWMHIGNGLGGRKLEEVEEFLDGLTKTN